MTRRLVGALLALVLGLFLPNQASAQGGVIRGVATDSAGTPLSGVQVSLEGTARRMVTRADGRFEFRGVTTGAKTLRARGIGFVPGSSVVQMAPGDAVDVTVVLSRVPIEVAALTVIGSRARHTAAEELAVPVDVFTSEDIKAQGSSATSEILQSLAPSVNFPRQTVTDANDIVRPFTLRGLSPDQSLVLVNGWRRHQTALVNNFAYGMPAGSSGVDLNAIPAGAIDRMEVLRDGASAEYGSDAIAGVVNIVTRDGVFSPFLTADAGRYITGKFPDDGTAVDINAGWGLGLGRGSLALFAEFRDRQPTNRAWADPYETCCTGVADSIDGDGNVVLKRNGTPQPNHHWGDGLEKDVMTLANLRMPIGTAGSEFYAFGDYSFRRGTGNGYRRYGDADRNWAEIYPLGYLPEFHPDVTDYSATAGWRGATGGWALDLGATYGANDFLYNLRNTMNVSLGPCLDTACAPGDDGIFGNGDDPGIPNQTSFDAGTLSRDELLLAGNASRTVTIGFPAPVHLAFGAAWRREGYKIEAGEPASYIDGGHLNRDSLDAPGGSQVFAGFGPSDASDTHRTNIGLYGDAETNLNAALLANVAARYEHYSDFGNRVSGKLALRWQPSQPFVLRGAVSTGFRAPGLSQVNFSKIATNFIFDVDSGYAIGEDFGIFPATDSASRLLGSKPLKPETSVNFSGGFAWTPRPGLTFTADLFYIKITDRILLGATFDDDTSRAILAAGGFPDIGGVQYFTNGLDTKTSGLDLTADWRIPTARGWWAFTAAANYTKNEIDRVDGLPAVLANSDETGLIDTVTAIAIEDERPDWRATLTAQFTRDRWHSLVRASYYGGFSSAQPGYCDACRESYGAKTLTDVETGFQFDQMSLSIGIRNLFDVYPDQADPVSQMNSFGIFPWAAASPFGFNGRYIYTRAEIALTY
jgi:iron complex outermembrane recepter protein